MIFCTARYGNYHWLALVLWLAMCFIMIGIAMFFLHFYYDYYY
jgi:putative exporter of polyketide antibiotics